MEELRKQLTELINSSTLPAECIYYVYKDVFRDLQEQYTEILRQAEVAKQQLPAQEEKEE